MYVTTTTTTRTRPPIAADCYRAAIMCATVLFRRQTSYGGNAGSREPTADIDRGSADAQQLSRRRELITALTAAAAAGRVVILGSLFSLTKNVLGCITARF